MSCVIINCTGETFTPTKSGAICTWTWEMCQAAKKNGIHPLVITRKSDAKPYFWPKTVFITYPWIPNFRGTGIGRLIKIQQRLTGWGHPRQGTYVSRVVRAIRKCGAGELPIVVQNDPEMAVHLRLKFPKAYLLHHFHNSNECDQRFRAAFVRSVNVATAVSKYCAQWNGNYFGTDIQIIFNGVDTNRFFPAKSTPPDPPVINFVGRTDRQKAPDLLLRAAILLSDKTKKFSVQILGSRFYGYSEPDAYQSEIELLSRDLEQRGISVRRPGFINRDDLPGELRKARINVVPSRWDEPCGLVTFEGMACGLATVVSRTGGTPEVVGDAALLFNKDSIEELADHLHKLVTNTSMCSNFASKARARAEELTWDKTWQRLSELLGLQCTNDNLSSGVIASE